MSKGTRMIKGQQYLLCGRVTTKEEATAEREQLLTYWEKVRIIKISSIDFLLYVHAAR